MPFEARVFIQGVGMIGRSDDGQSLEAHFPTQQAAVEFGLVDDNGVPQHDQVPLQDAAGNPTPPICAHHAFIQFSALHLGATEDIWLTTMLDRETVEVVVTGANVNPLTIGGGPAGTVDQIADLNQVLAGIVTNPRQLRTDLVQVADRQRLLQAVVRVPRGIATGFLPHRWRLGVLANGSPRDVEMSGAVQVELGSVDELALRITSFNNGSPRDLRLLPDSTGVAEVWIRHFCSFARPDPNETHPLDEGLIDVDFLLNYSLLEGVRNLTAAAKRTLPLPVIPVPGGIGGQHAQCQSGGR